MKNILVRLLSLILIICCSISCTKVTLEEVDKNGNPIPPEKEYTIDTKLLKGTWIEEHQSNTAGFLTLVFESDSYYIFNTSTNVVSMDPGVYIAPAISFWLSTEQYATNLKIYLNEEGDEIMIISLDNTTMKTDDNRTFKKVATTTTALSSIKGLIFNLNALFPGITFNDSNGGTLMGISEIFQEAPTVLQYTVTSNISAILEISYITGSNLEDDYDEYFYSFNLIYVGHNVGICNVYMSHTFPELDFIGYNPYYKRVTISNTYRDITFMFQ